MRSRLHKRVVSIVSGLVAGMFFLQAIPAEAAATDPAPAGAVETLKQAFETLHWVGYSPTHYDPNNKRQPSRADLEADLQKLKDIGFGGIVTYGSSGSQHDLLPQVATEKGMKMVTGIWALTEAWAPEEISNAIADAKKYPCILGICVGNEGLAEQNKMSNRYTRAQLEAVIDRVRSQTQKPTTTAQQWKSYAMEGHHTGDASLYDICDFIFPTIHPYWEHKYNAGTGADWTIEKYAAIKNKTNKPVMIKEVGYPTAGQPHTTNATQTEYYEKLQNSPYKHGFVYFEAFDQYWKNYNKTEPHWGLFDSNRNPKPVVSHLKLR